jgi:Methylamine utilisation protein MauE
MGVVLLVSRLLLACVFLIAGVAKLADLAASRRAVAEFGVPERLVGVVGVGLPVFELLVAVALIPSGSARFGALGALSLLVVFVVGIALALRRGTEADCHCFGQLHSAPIGWRTLVRSGVLAAAAALTVLAGWHDPGISMGGSSRAWKRSRQRSAAQPRRRWPAASSDSRSIRRSAGLIVEAARAGISMERGLFAKSDVAEVVIRAVGAEWVHEGAGLDVAVGAGERAAVDVAGAT